MSVFYVPGTVLALEREKVGQTVKQGRETLKQQSCSMCPESRSVGVRVGFWKEVSCKLRLKGLLELVRSKSIWERNGKVRDYSRLRE